MKSNYKRRMQRARDIIVAHIPSDFRRREIPDANGSWWVEAAAAVDLMNGEIRYGHAYVKRWDEVQEAASKVAARRNLNNDPRAVIEALDVGMFKAALAMGTLCRALNMTPPDTHANEIHESIREAGLMVKDMANDLAYLREVRDANDREIERLKAANAALTAIVLTHAADAAGVNAQPIKEVIQ